MQSITLIDLDKAQEKGDRLASGCSSAISNGRLRRKNVFERGFSSENALWARSSQRGRAQFFLT